LFNLRHVFERSGSQLRVPFTGVPKRSHDRFPMQKYLKTSISANRKASL